MVDFYTYGMLMDKLNVTATAINDTIKDLIATDEKIRKYYATIGTQGIYVREPMLSTEREIVVDFPFNSWHNNRKFLARLKKINRN